MTDDWKTMKLEVDFLNSKFAFFQIFELFFLSFKGLMLLGYISNIAGT